MNNLKKQKGSIEFIGLIFLVVALYFINITYENYKTSQLEEYMSTPPSTGTDERYLIDEYLKIDTPKIKPDGLYEMELKESGISDAKVKIYFKGDKIIKEMNLTVDSLFFKGRKFNMTGEANYKIIGSVITYSNITGDKAMFQEIGDAFETSENTITFKEASDKESYTLQKKDGLIYTNEGKSGLSDRELNL